MLKKVVLFFVNFLEQSDVLENSFSLHKVVAKVSAENYSNYLKFSNMFIIIECKYRLLMIIVQIFKLTLVKQEFSLENLLTKDNIFAH